MTERPKANHFVLVVSWLWIVGAILKLAFAYLLYLREDMEAALFSFLIALLFFGLSFLWHRLAKKRCET